MKGMLDRIEDGQYAVILLEQQKREMVLPVERLPVESHVGSWFDITIEGGEVTSIALDERTSGEQSSQASELLQKLKSKSSGSKFKRE